MGQINIKKESSFSQPNNGQRGLGFLDDGSLVIVKEDGSYEAISSMTPAFVANRGVGAAADLPVDSAAGDCYVANDTFKVYLAESAVGWNQPFDLIKGQFVTDLSTGTDNSPIYQYTGTELKALTPKKVVTDSLDFSTITFDENGVSEETLESVYDLYYDTDFMYMKRVDDYWIRTKIHKEVTPPGGLPE